MNESAVQLSKVEDEYVEFWAAGARACGEFRCVACGYAVVTFRFLPRCPCCDEGLWEQDAWSPFTRMAGVWDERRGSLGGVIRPVTSAGSGLQPAPN